MAIIYTDFERWWAEYRVQLGIGSQHFERFDAQKKEHAKAAWIASRATTTKPASRAGEA